MVAAWPDRDPEPEPARVRRAGYAVVKA